MAILALKTYHILLATVTTDERLLNAMYGTAADQELFLVSSGYGLLKSLGSNFRYLASKALFRTSVVDTDPNYIPHSATLWIRILIRFPNKDPDLYTVKNRKKGWTDWQ